MEREEIICIYDEVLTGKRKQFPNEMFIGITGKQYLGYMTRYLIEEKLKIPIHEIPHKIKAETLWSHRLRPGAKAQGWKYFDLINNAYEGQFLPFDFHQVPQGYWQGSKGRHLAIEAMKYVVESKCKLPLDQIPLKVNHQFFKQHNLVGVFCLFEQSPYTAMDAVYPGVFKPWQFANVPMNCWKETIHVDETMDWLLFTQLHYKSYEEALRKIRKTHFFEYKLTGLLQVAFDYRMKNVKKWIAARLKDDPLNKLKQDVN
ncbi:DUF4046 domain-containing protein [Priestia aryabhattai]